MGAYKAAPMRLFGNVALLRKTRSVQFLSQSVNWSVLWGFPPSILLLRSSGPHYRRQTCAELIGPEDTSSHRGAAFGAAPYLLNVTCKVVTPASRESDVVVTSGHRLL